MLRPPPARAPTAPMHPYRTRAPLRFAGLSAAPPPARCWSRQWVSAPDWIPPPPTVHCCQPPLAVPVDSGTGPACSTPPLAPGRTRSDSIRSIRTPQLPARPLAGSAGAVLHKPVLHSCPYFITKLTKWFPLKLTIYWTKTDDSEKQRLEAAQHIAAELEASRQAQHVRLATE